MINKLKIIAIIPARKGSKGLKNKNILKINGKTLLEYAIINAKESKYINFVTVSTDSKRIQSIAKKNNVNCEKLRPKIISGDRSSINDAIKDSLKNIKFKPDYIVELHPTYIFRKTQTIDKAIELLIKNKKYDSLISINEIKNTCHPDFVISMKNLEINYKKSPTNFNRQFLTPRFSSLGLILISKFSSFQENKSMIGKKCIGFVVNNSKEIVDINNKIEFEFAKKIYNKNIL
jgi:CMP-N-acetylneuraminic acid synthetase